MLIESLARLTLVNETCKEKGIVIDSEKFMQETSELIFKQIEILKNDLQFQSQNPGPYAFSLGKRTITIFPPTFTETSDWVMIVYNEDTEIKEDLYVFQTIYGLIENLAKAFKHIENASTSEQDDQSKPEA
jgi:hypothetical protein